jgi:hypothetical protein
MIPRLGLFTLGSGGIMDNFPWNPPDSLIASRYRGDISNIISHTILEKEIPCEKK